MLQRLTSTRLAMGLIMLSALASSPIHAETKKTSRPVHQFTLDNGMLAVVVPDHRAPVVTHMVWYRVGAADETPGVSGIAHFLEHLMFKSTENIGSGEFSKTVSRLGGQDNAFTSQDATAYFQRITKAHLGTVMKMEADRMVNLRLVDEEVLTERDVILEERRSRVENSPIALLGEQMDAALYQSHPYGVPVIGWMHEMAELDREDALAFYDRHYAPNNAILIVAGDVTEDEVRKLAEDTYGKIKADAEIEPRKRVSEPPSRAPRRVTLRDARAGQPAIRRYYLAPSYQSDKPGDAEALDLLMKIVADGATSRLYKELVVKRKVAVNASGYYAGYGLDYGKIALGAVPAEGTSLEELEAAIDEVLADVKANGVTQVELDRARKAYIAEYVYDVDNQSSLARRYGWGLVVGATVEEIDGWPDALRKVTLDDLKRVAETHLNLDASVTGLMIPEPKSAADARNASGKSKS